MTIKGQKLTLTFCSSKCLKINNLYLLERIYFYTAFKVCISCIYSTQWVLTYEHDFICSYCSDFVFPNFDLHCIFICNKALLSISYRFCSILVCSLSPFVPLFSFRLTLFLKRKRQTLLDCVYPIYSHQWSIGQGSLS